MDMGRVIREVEAPAPLDIPFEDSPDTGTPRVDEPDILPSEEQVTAREEVAALVGAE